MYIKEITDRHRRDLKVTMACEHCQHEYKSTAYDDTHFHQHVVPSFKCPECGQTAGDDYSPRQTKYPDHQQL